MPIEVQVGDAIVEFPEGTSPDVMKAALRKRFPAPAPEPSMLEQGMAAPGQFVDRLLSNVIPGEAGNRLASNQSTAGQELAKATVPGYDEPAKFREIAAGLVYPPAGLAMMAGGGKGLEHGRALQKATVEMAGDTLRDPLTWGAMGALKRLGLVGKGLTAGANAIFALKAGEQVPVEFAEAKKLYDEQGFTPQVTEAIAKGVLLGGAAALGAKGAIHEGAGFVGEAAPKAKATVAAIPEKVGKIPSEAVQGGAEALGSYVGGLPGYAIGSGLGRLANLVLDRFRGKPEAAAPEAAAPVEAPAPEAPARTPSTLEDWKKLGWEVRKPANAPAPKPYVPEWSPEALGLEPLPPETSGANALAPAPVAAPAPRPANLEAVVQDVLRGREPEAGRPLQPKTIDQALEDMRQSGLDAPKPPDWTPQEQALNDLAHQADKARLTAKDLMARAFEAQLEAEAPGASKGAKAKAEKAMAKAKEAKTLSDLLLARFDESNPDYNPTYPKHGPEFADPHQRWLNEPVSPEAPPAAAPAPPVAPEAPPVLPDGSRALPGGRSGDAQSPASGFKGLDTAEKQAAFEALQRLLAGEPVEAPPTSTPTAPPTLEGQLAALLARAPQAPEGAPAYVPPPKPKPKPRSRIDKKTGLPLNPDGTVTLYHGTTAEGAKAITETGMLKSAGEPDVYLTTDPSGAGYGDGSVVAIRVRPASLRLDDEFSGGRKDFAMPVGRPGGNIRVLVEK